MDFPLLLNKQGHNRQRTRARDLAESLKSWKLRTALITFDIEVKNSQLDRERDNLSLIISDIHSIQSTCQLTLEKTV